MKTLTGLDGMQSQGDPTKDMGLVICAGCDELIDTLPTDGVKIFHSQCGREECKSRISEEW
ncbi:GapA-binding peptide SR1P [Paenibacillus lemnae]|uniref:GapA-binding peptide SR1P n=1 Tax=Paenibacillus lemnae TaxID=1330551 RepID=A0A848M4X6_PAELE|nr:GapA-binding peptide SR1P [Paenibacillus lemnae]NMO95997.1 GapA-binding peptide SR1P [Paenibacillus lemnae]